jgi:hypothetical protein
MPKKTVKKPVKKVAKSEAAKLGFGRPKGSKNRIHEGLEIVEMRHISKLPDVQGLRRVVLATSNREDALRLQRLADLVSSQDKNFMSLITPAELKKVAKKKKAQPANA